MRTRVLRLPIVFLRVHCSNLILLIKTVCCSIRFLYHSFVVASFVVAYRSVPLETRSCCSPKFLLTSHPHWRVTIQHVNRHFHDTVRLSMKSASSSKILLPTHTASHSKQRICIKADMSAWSLVWMNCVLRPFVTNICTALFWAVPS